MAASSNSSMMSTIDSLKEKMSDEVYLALCEKMKELHTEQQQVIESRLIPVCIWFMSTRTFYTEENEYSDGITGERYRIDPAKKIVMMTRGNMEGMKIQIDISPMHSTAYLFSNCDCNRYVHQERSIGDAFPIDTHQVEVYRVEEVVEV
jgi:hypothetical protein